MRKKYKRGLLFALFLIIVGFLQPASAQAPAASIKTSPPSIAQSDVNNISDSAFVGVIHTVICAVSGQDPLHPLKGTCFGSQTQKDGTVSHSGAANLLSTFIGQTYSIPVSSSQYGQYLVGNFGITKPTYAASAGEQCNNQDKPTQGVGFCGVLPLLKIWQMMRNVAYLGFVLVFTVIGLAIVFRVKIDARTVMTVQNQIPKIIFALILVTFSYALAGFMIDIMYVATYLVLNLLGQMTSISQSSVNDNVFLFVNNVFTPNAPVFADQLGIMSLVFTSSQIVAHVITNMFLGFTDTVIGQLFAFIFLPVKALAIACNVIDKVPHLSQIPGLGLIDNVPFLGSIPLIGGGGPECNIADHFVDFVIAFIAGVAAFVVVLIAVLFSLFRVWFLLIKAYIFILVDVVLAPLWITVGLIPGSSIGFGRWFRHLTAHLLVFPATVAYIGLAKALMDAVAHGKNNIFMPPLLGGESSANAIVGLIGLGFILQAPQLLDQMRKVMQSPSFGLTGIKAGFAAGGAVPKEVIGSTQTFLKGTPTPGEKGTGALLRKFIG